VPAPPFAGGGAERAEPAWARGRIRLALLRDLAIGEDRKLLAQHLGVKISDIKSFELANAREISQVVAELAGKLASETAGLWSSKKHNRIAELQQSHEDLELVLTFLRGKGVDDGAGLGSRRHFNTLRGQIAVLAAIADEMEPRRGQPTFDGDKPTRYVIEGVDLSKLI
jgi:hypothetical protein